MADHSDPQRVDPEHYFVDDEAPTRPGGLQARSAIMLAGWRSMPQIDQMFFERLAGAWQALSLKDRAWLRQVLEMILAAKK